MVALLAYVAYLAVRDHASLLAITGDKSLSLGRGTSITIGGLIIGATLMPDLARFARRRRDVLIAALLAYGLGFPLVLALAGIPTLAAGQKDLILLITMLGLGGAAMAILILSTWTTNAFNLYVCTLVLGTVLPRQKSWRLTVAAGLLGTAFCFGGIGDAVVPYLTFIGAVIPPIAGVYLADFWIVRKATSGDVMAPGPGVRWDAVLSCAAGTSFAFFADFYQTSVTHVVPLDAILSAFLVYVLIGTLRSRPSAASG
jgi:cytosine permease